ncbi:MAG: hypothetical protein ACRDV0_03300 [Acidimicrobiales bacterium]
MSRGIDLLDYDAIRGTERATMFVLETASPVVVVGSAQRTDLIDPDREPAWRRRRRRGGGGVVLLQPGDLWVDWWIPTDDARWRPDATRAATLAGSWWADALRERVDGEVTVHDGPLVTNGDMRDVCFAGVGPGEVLVDGRKAVGLTQWRVREGTLVSTLLPVAPTVALVGLLASPPTGLADALNHATRASLGLDDPATVLESLERLSGPIERSTLAFA